MLGPNHAGAGAPAYLRFACGERSSPEEKDKKLEAKLKDNFLGIFWTCYETCLKESGEGVKVSGEGVVGQRRCRGRTRRAAMILVERCWIGDLKRPSHQFLTLPRICSRSTYKVGSEMDGSRRRTRQTGNLCIKKSDWVRRSLEIAARLDLLTSERSLLPPCVLTRVGGLPRLSADLEGGGS